MRWLLFWTAVVIIVKGAWPPISPVTVTAPGSNTTLECSFTASKNHNLTNLIVNWQYGEMVVHSFYLGRDQLDRQGKAYRGRTHLFKDVLLDGNASLRLTNLQPEDKGEYTCYVTNEHGISSTKLLVILAAPFDEPLLSLQPKCNSFNITVTVSNGFPLPELRWHDSSGRDINQTSSVQLDTRGRYKVSSNIDFMPNGIETITMEMKHAVLHQSFTRLLLLYPPPDPCQECCLLTSPSRNKVPVAVVAGLLSIAVFILLFFFVKKLKQSQNQHEEIQMD